MKLTFWWESDEVCTVTLNGRLVIQMDHGPHGWDGMTGIRDALTRAAELAGWVVTVIGEEGI